MPPPGEAMESSSENSEGEAQEDVTPVKKMRKTLAKTPINRIKPSPVITPRSLGSSSYSLPSPATPSTAFTLENGEEKSFHNQLSWLKDENRKDKSGRRPSHPEFNARTLHVMLIVNSLCVLNEWSVHGLGRFLLSSSRASLPD